MTQHADDQRDGRRKAHQNRNGIDVARPAAQHGSQKEGGDQREVRQLHERWNQASIAESGVLPHTDA